MEIEYEISKAIDLQYRLERNELDRESPIFFDENGQGWTHDQEFSASFYVLKEELETE